jgi:2-polyprenyl-3-methyl-5-hydroxy-6-metoxy-1,4-benzoquinol methylase
VLAPRTLPAVYAAWNKTWQAPDGRQLITPTRFRHAAPVIRYRGPFAWQPNSSTRVFEYPWAHEQVVTHGSKLNIVEIGGGLSGLQFVLAGEGHHVTNVDPGLAAKGKGWRLNPAFHRKLCDAFGANVALVPTTIDAANVPDGSVDLLLCVSVLEHFTDEDVDAFVQHAPRLLKRGGVLVLTVDLFLDVAPFCSSQRNKWGCNLDIRRLLERSGLELQVGAQSELLGHEEFESERVMRRLSEFMMGAAYPVLTQCLVARKPVNA